MENKRDEQVIFLKDLLFIALYRWKAIICWAIVLAALLGAGKGLLSFRDMKNDALQLENAQQQEMAMEVYESRKDNLQQQIEVNRENARQQQKYLKDSVLMNLDPYNHYEVYLSVFVDTGYQILPGMEYQNPDYTDPLIRSYTEFFFSEENMAVLADVLGTEAEYIPELISTEVPEDARSIILRITADSEASAESLLQTVIAQINKKQPVLVEAIAEHTLQIKEQYTQKAINADLAQLQQDQSDKLTKLNDSIMDLQTQKNNLLPPEVMVVSSKTVVKEAIIFAVIGGMLGVFLVIIVAWLKHLAGSKIYSRRTLASQTGIKVLCCVDTTSSTGKLEKKLRALEGRSSTPIELQSALLATTVCQLNDARQTLLIVNDTETDYGAVLAEAIQKVDAAKVVVCAGSLLFDTQALEQLKCAEQVLLIAKCGSSRYDHVLQQQDLIEDFGKQLLGCVLLDG